jgi:hypothetical protein
MKFKKWLKIREMTSTADVAAFPRISIPMVRRGFPTSVVEEPMSSKKKKKKSSVYRVPQLEEQVSGADKQFADEFFLNSPSGMKQVMIKIIEKSVPTGRIAMAANMGEFTDKDKRKLSAYRVLAADMGYTIGKWGLTKSGTALATIQ